MQITALTIRLFAHLQTDTMQGRAEIEEENRKSFDESATNRCVLHQPKRRSQRVFENSENVTNLEMKPLSSIVSFTLFIPLVLFRRNRTF